MKILLYRYYSICEPDIISAFGEFGLEVVEENLDKESELTKRIEKISEIISKEDFLFVFSINFFPFLADICQIYRIPYVCWTVDSPVLELFSPSIKHDTNCIFMFDYAQYLYFSEFNPNNIHYLPLASATERFDKVLNTPINYADKKRFSADISFVGSLYSEKNNLNSILTELPEYERGYIDGIVAASLKVYGANFIENCVNDQLIEVIKDISPKFCSPISSVTNSDSYVVANDYIGIQVTEEERINTLNKLAESFDVKLFTMSDVLPLKNVHVCGKVNSLDEMPYVFKNSKINLNMTSKSIQTGIPLRIFDIMGCGGFVMTNYQGELPDYFDIGVDLEAYGSLEELIDKCGYYLKHDDEREKIALNGYEKVKNGHQYIHRINKMIPEVLKVVERMV